jgi:hypothetical protein
MTDKIEALAKKLIEAKQEETRAGSYRRDLQDKFFAEITKDYASRDKTARPVTTITVPGDFWEKTNLTMTEFLETRFPGWELESVDTDGTMHLRKSSAYMAAQVEVGDTKITKSVTEYQPQIDWATLKEELPEVFDRLVLISMSYELDEAELERMIEDRPEILTELRRHMTVKKPALKALTGKVKNDE